MAELKLFNLQKKFESTLAVDNVTVTVKDGEFVTLLGPSGCGKTTTLRMIAGFIKPTHGEIIIDDKTITSTTKNIFLPPDKRDMGMVFQSYAVWPHMKVFNNVAYPLKFKKLSKNEINERVDKVLELVKLSSFGNRYPHQLSGGQQQRVALARALVMEPSVLLLDEPLSNLDAKLRESMRYEIVELQRRLKITVVYVTHDQVEAMSMSDRVVVMNFGIVHQIDEPRIVYQKPVDKFVADFIGIANFLPCTILNRDKTKVNIKLQSGVSEHLMTVTVPEEKDLSENVVVVLRPEDIDILPNDPSTELRGLLERQIYIGDKNDCFVRFGDISLRVETEAKTHFETGQEVSLVFHNPILLNNDK